MRGLLLHARKFSYTPVKKEIEVAELAAKGEKISFGRCLVFFVAFEEGDGEANLDIAVKDVKSDSDQVKEKVVVVYPFVHLTERPLAPDASLKLLGSLAKKLGEQGLEVHKAPFGWTKSFSVETMPHALAERGVRA